MDKIIEKKTGLAAAFTKKAIKYWAGAALAIVLVILIITGNGSAVRVDAAPSSQEPPRKASSMTISASAARSSR